MERTVCINNDDPKYVLTYILASFIYLFTCVIYILRYSPESILSVYLSYLYGFLHCKIRHLFLIHFA